MKLCITSVGKELDAKIDPTFGRAPYFVLIDTDSNAVESIENVAATQGPGIGIDAAQLLSDKGVDGVLTGNIGQNAFQVFQAAGIQLFVGASSQDTVEEALAKFNKGDYGNPPSPVDVPPCEPAGRRRGMGRGFGRGQGRGRGRCRQD